MANQTDEYTSAGLVSLINALPMAIVVINRNIQVVLANKTTETFMNKNNQALIGRVGGEAFDCINRNDAEQGCGFGPECSFCGLRALVSDTFETGKAHQQVDIVMTLDVPGKRYLRVSTSPLILNNNAMVLLAIEDMTEVKRNENLKLEQEKLAAVLETAGAVCHEFNQPLQVITGFCQLIEEEPGHDPETKRNIGLIMNAALKMGNLNRKLMSITKYRTKPYMTSTIIDLAQASSDD